MFTKFCSAEVLDVKTSPRRIGHKTSSLTSVPSFDTLRRKISSEDRFLYVKTRAISSSVNKNFDSWPACELAGMDKDGFSNLIQDRKNKQSKIARVVTSNEVETKGNFGFRTFIGRPIFVDHNNSDPSRTRGVVVDSVLHIEPDDVKTSAAGDFWNTPDAHDYHNPQTWVELVLEIDAEQFPKLAKAIEDGDIDSVSMGANVGQIRCSVCDKTAQVEEEFCNHIRNKGEYFFSQKHGRKVLAAEICEDVNFFEISCVFDPADPTALMSGRSSDRNFATSSTKTADKGPRRRSKRVLAKTGSRTPNKPKWRLEGLSEERNGSIDWRRCYPRVDRGEEGI